MDIECPNCNGTGKDRDGLVCIVCGGTGVHHVSEETIELMIKNGDLAC